MPHSFHSYEALKGPMFFVSCKVRHVTRVDHFHKDMSSYNCVLEFMYKSIATLLGRIVNCVAYEV